MIEKLCVDLERNSGSVDCRARGGQGGFTLVELMVVLALMAVLAAMLVPAFSELTLGSKLRSQANDLAGGALLARSEAIKRNAVVRMCVSANGSSCAAGGWGQGWLVFSDVNDNGTVDAPGDTVLLKHQAAANGFSINGSVTSVRFMPTGVGATAAIMTVCRASATAGEQKREVSISATGRAKVTRVVAGACP
jgi:type IV fimbrial biogenesis protein FimT